MRFIANMGISPLTVAWLRVQGHDALRLPEEGLQHLADEEIVLKAREERRIILTMDLDFSSLLAMSREQLPSVILFRLSNERSEVVNERLMVVLRECESDLAAGAIISVSDNAIRVRRLPI